MQVGKNIFRQYDIRGREGAGELSAETFELIGRAYGSYLSRKNIKNAVIGRDIRSTSQQYAEAATKGLLSAGINVINIGVCLTPMIYWAQYFFKTKGGVMITASHNPKGWNGAKLATGYSETMSGDQLQDIYKMIKNKDFVSKKEGKEKKEDIKTEYIRDLTSRINIHPVRGRGHESRPASNGAGKKFKIVVNTGNGTAGLFAPELLRAIGCKIVEHNTKPDPNYPNYTPNPSELEMMADTAKIVIKNKADLGFAFDGDGDRLGLVDEKGQTIWPDQYLIFLARQLLKKEPGAKIIFDVKSSQAIEDDVRNLGGIPIMTATGHTNIKRAMKREGAELASELSGHVYIKHNYYGFDDALFVALSLLEYFSSANKKVSKLFSEISQYVSSPGYHVECSDDNKFGVVENIKKEFKKEGYEVIEIDGARVKFPNLRGWGLVRVSNTSPNITLRFEAKTEQNLEKIKEIFKAKLEKYGVGGEWKVG